jgi:hypothetical protein
MAEYELKGAGSMRGIKDDTLFQLRDGGRIAGTTAGKER